MEIRLEHLSKIFTDKQKNETRAVDDLNVVVPSGKLIGLLGPSGCGKSTTLFMIAGLHEPTSGKIFFGEEDVTELTPEKRGIGLVFQNYALYPHMTIRQNIMFPLENLKMPRLEIEERTEEIAKLVGISHLLDRKPAQLSGGQQQRVAIARALVKEPRVLLLDEPLSNLDARLRLQMREEIKRIQRKTGITAVFVTHDQEEAMSICDEIVLMEYGVEQQRGIPQEIYDNPKNLFVAKFLGTPPINLFKAHLKDGKVFVGEDALLDAKNITINRKSWDEVKKEHPIVEKDNSMLTLRVVGTPHYQEIMEPLLNKFSKVAGNFKYVFDLQGSGEGFSKVQGRLHKRANHKMLTTDYLTKYITKELKNDKLPSSSPLFKYRKNYLDELSNIESISEIEIQEKRDRIKKIEFDLREKIMADYNNSANSELKAIIDPIKERVIQSTNDTRAHLGVSYRELNLNTERGAQRFMRPFLNGAIVPVVSNDCSLEKISFQELKLIFSKRYKKWNRLNPEFADEKIITYLPNKTSAAREFALTKLDIQRKENGILSWFPIPNEKSFKSEKELIEELKADKNGIGFISYKNLKDSGLRQLPIDGKMATDESIITETYPFATRGLLIATSNPKYPIDELTIAFLDYVKTAEGDKIIREKTNFYPEKRILVGVRPEGYELSDNGIFNINYQYYESIGRDLSLVCEHPHALKKTFRLILQDVKASLKLHDNKAKFNILPDKIYVFDEETGERVL